MLADPLDRRADRLRDTDARALGTRRCPAVPAAQADGRPKFPRKEIDLLARAGRPSGSLNDSPPRPPRAAPPAVRGTPASPPRRAPGRRRRMQRRPAQPRARPCGPDPGLPRPAPRRAPRRRERQAALRCNARPCCHAGEPTSCPARRSRTHPHSAAPPGRSRPSMARRPHDVSCAPRRAAFPTPLIVPRWAPCSSRLPWGALRRSAPGPGRGRQARRVARAASPGRGSRVRCTGGAFMRPAAARAASKCDSARSQSSLAPASIPRKRSTGPANTACGVDTLRSANGLSNSYRCSARARSPSSTHASASNAQVTRVAVVTGKIRKVVRGQPVEQPTSLVLAALLARHAHERGLPGRGDVLRDHLADLRRPP